MVDNEEVVISRSIYTRATLPTLQRTIKPPFVLQFYHVSNLPYPARWYPPGAISNHSYTHCNLVVHPLDPPTMWAITTLW